MKNYNTDLYKIENVIKSKIGYIKNTDTIEEIDNDINIYNKDNKDNMVNESYSKNIFKKLSNKILKTLF